MNEIAAPTAKAKPADPLINKIEADWNSVAHGGGLDELRRDLHTLQVRDSAAGQPKNQYFRDLAAINVDLQKKGLLPNMSLWGVSDNRVVAFDNGPLHKMLALEAGPAGGMTQVVGVQGVDARGHLQLEHPVAEPNALKKPINADGVHQGREVPDCRLQARLASLAVADPGSIARMIKDNGNGTYTVTFPGDKGHPETISAPSEWEKQTFSNGTSGWALLIDKAYRQRIHQPFGPYEAAQDIEGLLTGRTESIYLPGEDCSKMSNFIDWTRSLFGAEPTCKPHLSDKSLARQVADNPRSGFLARPADTGKYLQEALSNHMIVNTFVPSDVAARATYSDWIASDRQGRKIVLETQHAYSVTGYDATKEIVSLRNPWGVNIDEKGRAVGDGNLTMPLEQFKRMMGVLDLELTGLSR